MLESITDFLLAVGILWLLCVAMPLLGEIRRDQPIDDDIDQDWQDIRTAIRITNRTIINNWRNRK